MNKRDAVLDVVNAAAAPAYIPAAFFLHFDEAHQRGQAAIDRQLEFFRHTDMDLVKIQYEQKPPAAVITQPADWAQVPACDEAHFEPTLTVVEGLLQAAQREALVILTVYSPFMWAKQTAGAAVVERHLREDPAAVQKGLAILTENVLTLLRACRRLGIDGFYVSTQGGEAGRFAGTEIFQRYIQPTDRAVWDEVQGCAFNVLHVCDYDAGYADYAPFVDYPGQVVNCSLKLGEKALTPRSAAALFGRPFMGGLERLGVLATGGPADARRAAEAVLAQAPERFLLAADCTVPAETSWDNLRAAVDAAHQFRR